MTKASPLTVRVDVALLNVNAVLPDTIPASLNRICVFDPGAVMLPDMLPTKFAAVTLPENAAVVKVSELAQTLLPLLCITRTLLATPLPRFGSACPKDRY